MSIKQYIPTSLLYPPASVHSCHNSACNSSLAFNTRHVHLQHSNAPYACRMMQILIYLKETSDFQGNHLSALQFPSSDGCTLGSKHQSPEVNTILTTRLKKCHPDSCYPLPQRNLGCVGAGFAVSGPGLRLQVMELGLGEAAW